MYFWPKLRKMKNSLLISTLGMMLGILLLASCGDNDDAPLGHDISVPITGYWQIGEEDINGDGAIMGVVIHADGTVTEWQYTEGQAEPYSIGYKSGSWRVNGDHYEMQLSKGNDNFYTVTVEGNSKEEMYLSYNGKTSVVPFIRLEHLPGNGDNILKTLEAMKFSGFQMSDLTGYWELDEDVAHASGIYIDEKGRVSETAGLFGSAVSRTVKYHTGTITLNQQYCHFPFLGENYYIYAMNRDMILASVNGKQILRFVHRNTPAEVIKMESIMNATVPAELVGTWEAVHYTQTIAGATAIDVDITPSDSWAIQLYKKLTFTTDHKVRKYTDHDNYNYVEYFFSFDSQTISISDDLNTIITPGYGYTNDWTVMELSGNTLKLSHDGETYTYTKIR